MPKDMLISFLDGINLKKTNTYKNKQFCKRLI